MKHENLARSQALNRYLVKNGYAAAPRRIRMRFINVFALSLVGVLLGAVLMALRVLQLD
jgi:hypothetical protein